MLSLLSRAHRGAVSRTLSRVDVGRAILPRHQPCARTIHRSASAAGPPGSDTTIGEPLSFARLVPVADLPIGTPEEPAPRDRNMGSGRFFSALRMRRGELVVTAAAMHAGAAYALLFAAAPGATEVSQYSITRILHSAMPERRLLA